MRQGDIPILAPKKNHRSSEHLRRRAVRITRAVHSRGDVGGACRVHSRIESAWRDGGGFTPAQLLDHVEHFLSGDDALAL